MRQDALNELIESQMALLTAIHSRNLGALELATARVSAAMANIDGKAGTAPDAQLREQMTQAISLAEIARLSVGEIAAAPRGNGDGQFRRHDDRYVHNGEAKPRAFDRRRRA